MKTVSGIFTEIMATPRANDSNVLQPRHFPMTSINMNIRKLLALSEAKNGVGMRNI
jgi:hypothetical protein